MRMIFYASTYKKDTALGLFTKAEFSSFYGDKFF